MKTGLLSACAVLAGCTFQPLTPAKQDQSGVEVVAFVRDHVFYIQNSPPLGDTIAIEDCRSNRCRILFPKWSPDGRYLLYYRESLENMGQVEIRTVTFSGEKHIVTDKGAATRPADWSPDGQSMVYLLNTERFDDSPAQGHLRKLEVWTAELSDTSGVQNRKLIGEIGFGEGCGGGGRSNSANVYEEEGGFAYGYLAGILEWTPADILLYSNNCGSRGVGRFDMNAGREIEPYAGNLGSLSLDSSGMHWVAIDTELGIVLGAPDELIYTPLVQNASDGQYELVFFGAHSGRIYYTTVSRVGDYEELVDEMSQIETELPVQPYFDFTVPTLYVFDPTLRKSLQLWSDGGYAYAHVAEASDGSILFSRVDNNELLFEALKAGVVNGDNIEDLLPTVDVLRLAPGAAEPTVWLKNAQKFTFTTSQGGSNVREEAVPQDAQ